MITQVVTAGAAFVCMEPLTCAAHRWIMHGAGWALHRSHHETRRGVGGLEANDVFPVVFAGATVAMMALGSRVRSLHLLVAVGAGVTAYGAAYGIVHDVVVHRRLLAGLGVGGRLARLGAAHAEHHRTGRAPYGMLWPVVPLAAAGG